MTQRMTLGSKFALTSGGLIAAIVLLGGVSMYRLAGLNAKTQAIINDPLPGMALISKAESAFLELRGNAWRHIASPDAAAKAAMDRGISDLKGKVEQALREYEKTITEAEDRAAFEKIGPQWSRYLTALQRGRRT